MNASTKIPSRSILSWLLLIPVGLFFALAATHKALDPAVFDRLLLQLPSVPNFSGMQRALIRGGVVGAEFYIAASFLFNRSIVPARAVCVLLLASFSLLVSPYFDALGGDCGCVWRWVPFTPSTGVELVARNAIMAAVIFLSALLSKSVAGSELNKLRLLFCASMVPFIVAAGFSSTSSWEPPARAPLALSGAQDTPEKPNAVTEQLSIVVASTTQRTREALIGDSGIRSLKIEPSVVVQAVEFRTGLPVKAAFIGDSSGALGFQDLGVLNGFDSLADLSSTEMRQSSASLIVDRNAPTLIVLAEGFVPQFVDCGHKPDAELTVELRRASGVKLSVEDLAGNPVHGAHIAISVRDLGWPSTFPQHHFCYFATTKPSRNVELPTEQVGVVDVLVWAPGYAMVTTRIGPLASSVPISLRKVSTIAGVLMRGDFGGQLEVHARPVLAEAGHAVHARVDDDGAFALTNLPLGTDCIVIAGEDSEGGFRALTKAVHAKPPTSALVLSLEDTFQLDATVTSLESADQTVVPHVLTSLYPRVVLASGAGAIVNDATNGRWSWLSLPSPPGQRSDVWVTADGFLPAYMGNLPLPPGAQVDLGLVELEPSTPWDFQVMSEEDGRPISDAWLTFIPEASTGSSQTLEIQEAQTDPSGSATLDRPNCNGYLAVRAIGWAPKDLPITEQERRATPVAISMTRSGELVVTCLASDGLPVPGMTVGSWTLPDGEIATKKTRRDGTVAFDVAPGDIGVKLLREVVFGRFGSSTFELDLSVGSEEGGVYHVPKSSPGESRSVTINVPILRTLEVVLATGLDSGRTLVASIVPGTSICLDDQKELSIIDVPMGVFNSSGTVRLVNVPTGLSTLFIDDIAGNRRWRYAVDITGTSSPFVVELESYQVQVRVRDSTGEPLVGVSLLARVAWGGLRRIPRIGSMDEFSTPQREKPGSIGIEVQSDVNGIALLEDIPLGCRLEIGCKDSAILPTLGAEVIEEVVGDSSITLYNGKSASLMVDFGDRAGIPAFAWLESHSSGLQRAPFNASGQALFFGIRPGEWRLSLPPHEWTNTIELDAGEQRVEVVGVMNEGTKK